METTDAYALQKAVIAACSASTLGKRRADAAALMFLNWWTNAETLTP